MKERECADCQWFRIVEVRRDATKDEPIPGVCLSRPPQTVIVPVSGENGKILPVPQAFYPIITDKTWACGDFKSRIVEWTNDAKGA